MKTLKLFFLLIVSLLAVACRDKKNEPTIDDNNNDAVETLPTADQLTTTTAVPVAIVGSGFSEVAQAFINRVQQPLSDITDDTRAILVRGNDLGAKLSDPAVRSAIDSGAVLIIDQPTRKQLEMTIDSVCLAEDFILSMDGEEHDYHICYDMVALDRFGNLYVLNDIFDEDNDTTTIVMTPYLNGQHADPLAEWLNEYYGSGALSRSRARVRAATGDLASLLSAQNITKTYTLKPNGDWSHKISDRQCVFTVSTNIWVVYKFDDDADYYLIEQTVLGNSQNFWIGKWDRKHWHYQGFFLQNVYVDNKLWRNGKVLPLSQGAYLLDYSPTTTIGQTSVTTTESWNFSGQIGFNTKKEVSGAVSGGIGGSVGTTYSTQDMTITAKIGSDNACNNNACWSFDIKTDNVHKSWGQYSFVDPPALGRNAYKSSQCWQWKVEHPKTHGNLQFYYDVSFCFAYNCYNNYPPIEKETNYSNKIKNTEYITIRPPYRGEAK